MPNIDANKLRKDFLRFFELKGCKPLPSSSLQPPDASTLFTSAGMHQFKDDFMGNLVHGTRAATTVQKCMRTPDLENVGKTARHHTFFEMLGFFSFGDKLKGPDGSTGFFKNEAIRWIWEFYTSKDWCGLDVSKLYISVYGGDETGAGKDEEAANIWRAVLGKHWPKEEVEKRIFWLGEHDNFWPAGAPSQGPNGVCGPCSEIFYDLGEEYGQGDVASNGNRFMEIGNIVFTQFERSGPTPGKGTLTPLPAKNIDFGGGFERLVMVMDGNADNFVLIDATLETTLFMPIRKKLRWLGRDIGDPATVSPHNQDRLRPYARAAHYLWRSCGSPADESEFVASGHHLRFFRGPSPVTEWYTLFHGQVANSGPETNWWNQHSDIIEQYQADAHIREKRIADHIRAITFAMADGIVPKNDGAGYVIRRILRRAFRDGTALGFDGPFLHKLVPVIVEHYGDAYPELQRNTKAIIATIKQEEQQFSTTLERGLQLLAGLIREHQKRDDKTLDGKAAFDLYQSQGLPREVVQDELAAVGMVLDLHAYDEAEEEHRKRSKGGKEVVVFEKGWFQELKAKSGPTQFLGYETCEAAAKVIALVRDGRLFDVMEQGDTATVLLDRTPFYGESGGQVGDRGSLHIGDGVFEVVDTLKRDDYFMHEGKLLHGKLRVGDTVTARVDQQRRDRIRANHSATHLMHAALRKVLGEHVVQRGSEVGPERLRFDFSHPKALTFEERQEIERLVNQQVQANAEVGTAVMAPEEAQKAGAMALFGEKYGDRVRVLSMGVSSDAGVPPARVASVPDARVAGFQPAHGPVDARRRGRLPHWEAEGATYFVTFRLADSLAKEQRDIIEARRRDILRASEAEGRQLNAREKELLEQLFSERMDEFLNKGFGECHLKDDKCAKIVADALTQFEGERYELHAWCIMPNHVHVVFRPLGDHKLSDILHSWKSFTAKQCNKVLGRQGSFWMEESFDRLVRDGEEWAAKIRYTLENPAQAGLREWKWVGSGGPAAGETPATRAAEPAATRAGGTSATHRVFSMELCGGTHVARTGDIGYFRIVSEGSSAAGIRRIEAITGQDAYALAAEEAKLLAQLHTATKAQPGKVLEKVESLVKEVKDLKGKAKKSGGAGSGAAEDVRKSAETVDGVTIYACEVAGAEAPELLTIKDSLVQDGAPSAVLLGSRGEGRAVLLLSFTKDLVGRGLHAGKLIGEISRLVDGKGGGKPDTAQAGGKNPEGLTQALEAGRKRIREALQN